MYAGIIHDAQRYVETLAFSTNYFAYAIPDQQMLCNFKIGYKSEGLYKVRFTNLIITITINITMSILKKIIRYGILTHSV